MFGADSLQGIITTKGTKSTKEMQGEAAAP